MFYKVFIAVTIFLLIFVKTTYAVDPPILISPTNGSTVTSSRLEWQVPSYQLYSTNPYRVQVDDDISFSPSSSIYRDTYKTTTVYTPELYSGTWYWRVKARDTSGTWSDWSSIWSFTLADSTPTPTPSSTSNSSQTSSPSPSSSTPSYSFTISNIPSQINSNQSFNVSINLSSNGPNTKFYLKGAFKKADSSNYFGYTLVSGSWVKNSSTYSEQYPITTDETGNWSGSLEIMPDQDDSGYSGTDDYIFKVGKYNSKDSSPSVSWSNNEITIKISSVASSQTTTQTSTLKTSSSSISPSSSISKNSLISLSTAKPKANSLNQNATVAGIATSSSSPQIASEQIKKEGLNIPKILGTIMIIAGILTLGYIFLKNKQILNLWNK